MSEPLTATALTRLGQPPTRVSAQVATSRAATLPSNPSISDLQPILWGNRRFVIEEQLARKGGRGRTTWVRAYGVFLVELSRNNEAGPAYWCCQRCDEKGRPEFFSAVATSSAQEHLRR